MAKKYHVTCPACGYEFDVNYSEFSSLSDPAVGIIMRHGPYSFSCKCPQCHKRSRFNVTDNDLVS